ncbi:LOW QUALITY PROTEIN: neurochondrin-like [Limulus polyphemus]|uniref:LOW QUALITY PROTEIN: neurochondrin-like n=1 Tax=Limulus polyphemus TaxID=6850 RepID=A0ABM1BJZ5_LIMPO|nr:LOW QUALITY PROTEIN: neurochondrin-like [Limulus polyphemus]
MEDVHKYIERLHGAKNDTEKFAALLVLAEIMKRFDNDMDHIKQKDIFDAIGVSFLNRLLYAQQVPEGCPKEIFKSVALAILAALSTACESPAYNFICSHIDTFKEIIQSKEELNSPDDLTRRDILQCLLNVCSTEEGRNSVISKQFVSYLVNVATNSSQDREKALQILIILNQYFKSEVWGQDAGSFSAIMYCIAKEFKEDTTRHKFELCDKLTKLLIDNPTCSTYSHSQWSELIREGLFDLLKNKLGKIQRDSTLKLASAMVERFGLLWVLKNRDETETTKRDLSLLVHLVSIEVRMILEDRSVQEIVENIDVLSACYTVLEATITMMCDESVWHIESATTKQLLIALTDAFQAIISFLLEVSKEWDDWHKTLETCEPKRYVTLASVRVLSSWLAEETFALKEEVCMVIPCLLKIGELFFRENKEKLSKPVDQVMCDQDVDVIRFLSPALCHMSADDKTRKVLLDQNAPKLLFEYLDFQWLLWRKDLNKDSETCIITLCGIFMNLVVLEKKWLLKVNCSSLCKFLLSTVSHIPQGFEHITLKANITVLGLLIATHHYQKIKSCETSFHHFFSASVKFLWDAHQVDNSQDVPSLVVVQEYSKVWNDIMELWFLGIQSLSSLLSSATWVATFLLESGWPQHIISSLGKINSHAVENSVQSAYHQLLCCLLQNCPGAQEQLLNCGAMLVIQTHGLKELETLMNKLEM